MCTLWFGLSSYESEIHGETMTFIATHLVHDSREPVEHNGTIPSGNIVNAGLDQGGCDSHWHCTT